MRLFLPLLALLLTVSSSWAWRADECPDDCVHTETYWSHQTQFPQQSNTWSLCGKTWDHWIHESLYPNTTNALWLALAKQFIVAKFNVMSFVCIEAFSDVLLQSLEDAENTLKSSCSFVISDIPFALNVGGRLSLFNSGELPTEAPLCPERCPVCEVCETCQTCEVCETCQTCETCSCDNCPNDCSLCSVSSVTLTGSVQATIGSGLSSTTGSSGQCCTLTQGYWKNHDDWPEISLEKVCGVDLLTLLKTPPKKGNSFLILVHQYIAAILNTASNAQSCPINGLQDKLSQALVLLNTACSDEGYSDTNNKVLAIKLAFFFDLYNNGELGVPHCDGRSDSLSTELASSLNIEGSSDNQGESSSASGVIASGVLVSMVGLFL